MSGVPSALADGGAGVRSGDHDCWRAAHPSAATPRRWRVDRPTDRLLGDRVEQLSGWVEAPPGPFALRVLCRGRDLRAIACPHPASRPERPLRGFLALLVLQDLVGDGDEAGRLPIELWWGDARFAAVSLRVLPSARELATRFPLSRRRYAVAPASGEVRAAGSAASVPPPVVVFPGLGGVGGSSVNHLFRHELFARGEPLAVYAEADSPAAWTALCAHSPPALRWIDGHGCFDAARALGRPARRIAILREPVARLLSVVNYGSLVHPRDFPADDPHELAASGEARRLSMAAGLLRCAGMAYDPRMPDRELLAIAREQLAREYELVAITERFEETIFLVCRLLGLDSVGLWWRVLSAPRALDAARLPAATRRALERALAVDLALYDEAAAAFAARVAAAGLGPAIDDYRRDAAAQPELPDAFKTIECLRWRQLLADCELAAVLGRPVGLAGGDDA